MKAQRRMRRQKLHGTAPERSAARRPVPLAARELRIVRLIAVLMMAFGGMLLLKVAFTLSSGTAWDDLSTSSRETQPLEFWSFVAVYLVMGAGLVWQGVRTWRTR
jgi:hypothetical protein